MEALRCDRYRRVVFARLAIRRVNLVKVAQSMGWAMRTVEASARRRGGRRRRSSSVLPTACCQVAVQWRPWVLLGAVLWLVCLVSHLSLLAPVASGVDGTAPNMLLEADQMALNAASRWLGPQYFQDAQEADYRRQAPERDVQQLELLAEKSEGPFIHFFSVWPAAVQDPTRLQQQIVERSEKW